ncbi:hypothetical protein [Dactylosporangium sp. NPDC051484]|uniref:hypothetical protein n=1 Tax=Dactylosporangium sp. NPDC051484 TaxID=3154942 RepID=UPI00344E9279
MTTRTGPQWRVEFDAEVEFSNGGALQAQEFRLDIPGSDIDDEALGELFVRHLGLLMVGSTKITRKVLLREAHKGGRGVAAATGPRRVVELTGGTLHAGPAALVDLPVTLVRTLGSASTEIDRSTLVPFEVAGTAVVLHTGGDGHLNDAAAAWLAEQSAALVVTDAQLPHTVAVPVVTGVGGLDALPSAGARLHVVALSTGDGPGPARVYAVVEGG